jgi:hypothetical protein
MPAVNNISAMPAVRTHIEELIRRVDHLEKKMSALERRLR